jgi:hypothetical protein
MVTYTPHSRRAAALTALITLSVALPSLAHAQREMPPPPPEFGDPGLITQIESLSDAQVEAFLDVTHEEYVSDRELGGWLSLATGAVLGGVGVYGLVADPGPSAPLYGAMAGAGVGAGVTGFILTRTPSPYEVYTGKLSSDPVRRAREGRSAIELLIESERYERRQAGATLMLGGALIGALSVPLFLDDAFSGEAVVVPGTLAGISVLYVVVGGVMVFTKGTLEQRLEDAASGEAIALEPGLLVGPDGQVGLRLGFSW